MNTMKTAIPTDGILCSLQHRSELLFELQMDVLIHVILQCACYKDIYQWKLY